MNIIIVRFFSWHWRQFLDLFTGDSLFVRLLLARLGSICRPSSVCGRCFINSSIVCGFAKVTNPKHRDWPIWSFMTNESLTSPNFVTYSFSVSSVVLQEQTMLFEQGHEYPRVTYLKDNPPIKSLRCCSELVPFLKLINNECKWDHRWSPSDLYRGLVPVDEDWSRITVGVTFDWFVFGDSLTATDVWSLLSFFLLPFWYAVWFVRSDGEVDGGGEG